MMNNNSTDMMEDDGSFVKGQAADSHVQQLLQIISGDHPNPPLGRECGYVFSHRTHVATQFHVQGEAQWEAMVRCGLTWRKFLIFIGQRGCVQIGPLYLSWSQLEPSIFQRIFRLGHSYQDLCIAMTLQQDQHHDQRVNLATNQSNLRGLMKLYAASAETESSSTMTTTTKRNVRCFISNDFIEAPQDPWAAWPFSFDWGVVLDTLEVNNRRQMGTFAIFDWMSRHFRRIIWNSCKIPNDLFFRHILLNADSMVEHLDCSHVEENQVRELFNAMRRSNKLKSLKINRLDCDQIQMGHLTKALCACNTLTKIYLKGVSYDSPSAWLDYLVSMIECQHFADITFGGVVGRNLYRNMSSEEFEILRIAQTNWILNAIAKNENLRHLDIHEAFQIDDIHKKFVDHELIHATLDCRTDRSIILKMTQLLETDSHTNLALFGTMLCHLNNRKSGPKLKRCINKTFDLLRETGNLVSDLFYNDEESITN